MRRLRSAAASQSAAVAAAIACSVSWKLMVECSPLGHGRDGREIRGTPRVPEPTQTQGELEAVYSTGLTLRRRPLTSSRQSVRHLHQEGSDRRDEGEHGTGD